MENSGNSEFSNSNKRQYTLSFWQTFFLTIFGASGLILMVADGPLSIKVVSFLIVIAILLRLIAKSKRK